jgi:hypothetical protein
MINYIKKSLLFLLLLISFASFGQTIYEVKYTFNKLDQSGKETNEVDKEYDALFFYYPAQETNTMRVRYWDGSLSAYVIVEQQFKLSLFEQSGKQYWTMTGQNPTYVSTAKPTYKYNPDKIVLTKNPADKYYSPAYVTSDDGASSQTGKITSFNTLVKTSVDNDFLGKFGWRWPESDNKNNNQTSGNFDLTKSTLYLIQVTNSMDATLGLGFYENHKMIKSLFSDAAATCNINFKSIEVMGADYSKANVIKTIADFNPGPNDIVIFYYSGHGYRYDDQTSDWPRMCLSNTYQTKEELHAASLSLDDDVYKPLAAKNPHLLLVIGECCNTSVGTTPSMKDPNVQMVQGGYIMDPNAVKSLFKQSGKLLLATSKPYESTWYYQTIGGCFGNNFVSAISKETNFTNTNSSVNWKSIFDNSVQETVAYTKSGQTPEEQDPIMYFEIK